MKFRLIQVLPHVAHASARNVRDLIDMKLNFNFRVLTCDAWRMAAACGVAMLLVACSGVSLPEPVLAKPRVSKPRADVLRDETLASALRDAQALPLAEASAVTEDFLRALQAEVRLHDWKKPIEITGAAGSWELSFDSQGLESQGKPEWSPGLFDRLIPTGEMEVEGYRRILQGEGAGAAIVLAFEDIEKLRQMYAFRPRNGLYLPGTAILEFGKAVSPAGPTPVRLRIFNTLEERSARLGERSVPLAWNTTAALEFNLQNPYLLKNGLNGLLRPDRRTEDLGLFGMGPYDRNKIPVVFVHGLNSDPHIWKNIINEIEGDPVLSARYFPLLFLYPTGMPVPGAAARLRESLALYRNHCDPDGNDAGFDQMLVVGHSMGGLLTRLQVIDPGDELANAFFTRPISEIPWLGDDDLKSLEKTLKFAPQPFVKRVVFVAVPHQGSQVADLGLVRFAIRLIRLPVDSMKFMAQAVVEDPSLLNPELLQYHSLGLCSVDMLSPEHPYFKALKTCPMTVPYHSIIGDRGTNKGPASSDGVVPYWSSHVKGAHSEKIVPHGHSCTAESDTVDELLRIMKEHLVQ